MVVFVNTAFIGSVHGSPWATQHFNKMETSLPNNNNYEIKVKHTNSKYCRFCIRHEIPKLIKDNYLPGKVLEK